MQTTTIPAGTARDILDGDTTTGWTIVHNEQIGTRRWVSVHELVLQREADGAFFRAYYERGLTEVQDVQPFEEFGDHHGVEFARVERHTRLAEVTEYVTAPDSAA